MVDFRFNSMRKEIISFLENELIDEGKIKKSVFEWRIMRNYGCSLRQISDILETGQKAGRFILTQENILSPTYEQPKTEANQE